MGKVKADQDGEQKLELQAKRLMAKEMKAKLDSNRITHLHPSVLESVDREKQLLKISTRSVVSLMNQINETQKNMVRTEKKFKRPVKKPAVQQVVDNSVSRLNFLDMLRSNMQSK